MFRVPSMPQRRLLLGDQPSTMFICQVSPKPLDRNQDAVLETDQKVDMDERPGHPRNPALQLQAPLLEHRCMTTHDGSVAAVPIDELRQCSAARDLGCKRVPEMGALLLGDLSQSGQRQRTSAVE